MKRTPMPPRKTPLPRSGIPLRAPMPRATAKPTRPRHTGPTATVRAACLTRDDHRCVRCGRMAHLMQLHHRRPRAAGGSSLPDTNAPQNLLWLCVDCHAWTESDRNQARELGYLVAQGHDPLLIPVTAHHGVVLLGADATYRSAP